MLFRSRDLIDSLYFAGYYGGERLIKATLKRFHDFVTERDGTFPDRCLTIRYETGIPVRVGLAGSSAIIIATLRALMRFFDVSIPPERLAGLALSVETDELGIPAGLQDRVAQSFDGIMYMDFDRQHMLDYGHGRYERIEPKVLPPFYVAYCSEMGEGTEVTHSNLRYRFDKGDMEVRNAMKRLGRLTDSMRVALEDGDVPRMHELVNENFDIRASLVPIAPAFREMVNVARNCGASAKFCGSGGAIVGIADDAVFAEMPRRFAPMKINTLRPRIVGPADREIPT